MISKLISYPKCPICNNKLLNISTESSRHYRITRSKCSQCSLITMHAQRLFNFIKFQFCGKYKLEEIKFMLKNKYIICYPTNNYYSILFTKQGACRFPFNPIQSFHKLQSVADIVELTC